MGVFFFLIHKAFILSKGKKKNGGGVVGDG